LGAGDSGFESQCPDNMSKETIRPQVESEPRWLTLAYEKARKKIEEMQIQEQDEGFVKLYGEETVKRDLANVKRLEAIFAAESTPDQETNYKCAVVLEVISDEAMELYNWLGQDIYVVKTSKHDDFNNQTDSVIEQVIEGQEGGVSGKKKITHTAVSVDVTSSTHLEKKIAGILASIESGKLTDVKYYRSGKGDYIGPLRTIPKFVVGVDRESIRGLAELWLDEDKERRNLIAQHSVQFKIIYEIIHQAEAFITFAKKCGNHKAAEAYRNSLLIALSALQEKRKDDNLRIKMSATFDSDKVYTAIMDNLKRIPR
jgi:hypothetical protein